MGHIIRAWITVAIIWLAQSSDFVVSLFSLSEDLLLNTNNKFLSCFMILFVSGPCINPLISKIWNLVTPIKDRATDWEAELCSLLAISIGSTGIIVFTLEPDFVPSLSVFLGIFLAEICTVFLLLIYLRMVYGPDALLPDTEVVNSVDPAKINGDVKRYWASMIAMVLSLLALELIVLGSIYLILLYYLVDFNAVEFALNYILYCALLPIVLTLIFVDKVLWFGDWLWKSLPFSSNRLLLDRFGAFLLGNIVPRTLLLALILWSTTFSAADLGIDPTSLSIAYAIVFTATLLSGILFAHVERVLVSFFGE